VVVRVAEEGRAGEQITLHFTVSDSGVGIPEEKTREHFPIVHSG